LNQPTKITRRQGGQAGTAGTKEGAIDRLATTSFSFTAKQSNTMKSRKTSQVKSNSKPNKEMHVLPQFAEVLMWLVKEAKN